MVITVLALDQITKAAIRSSLRPDQSIALWPNVFEITHVQNVGAAFGLMPGQRSIFIATSLMVLVGIAVYWYRARPTSGWLVMSLGFVAGGSGGNLIDRAFGGGQVTDFFYFRLVDFPVFNLADTAIFVGVCMLVVWVLFGPEPDDEVDGSSDDDPTDQKAAAL